MLTIQIPILLSHHPFLSAIALCESSKQHPVWHKADECKFLPVSQHWSLNTSLLLKQYPAYLAHLSLIVYLVEGKWPYICCFVSYCSQGLFKHHVASLCSSHLFSCRFMKDLAIKPYSSTDQAKVWKKSQFE